MDAAPPSFGHAWTPAAERLLAMSGTPHVRALRGATTVERDDAIEIGSATRELLVALVERNALGEADIVSAFFTVTPDLASDFPARAAREPYAAASPPPSRHRHSPSRRQRRF